MRRLGEQSGVVYAEFLLAFAPFFLLFLGIVQMAFIAAAGLVVQAAATKAVRAAAVVLDDDPVFYDGEERRLLDFNGSTEDDGWVNDVGGILTREADVRWLQRCTNPITRDGRDLCCDETGQNCSDARTNQIGGFENRGGPRLRAIRRAAYVPLSAISPEWPQIIRWFPMMNFWGGAAPEHYSLAQTGIGGSPSMRFVTGFLAYNPVAAAINFPDRPGSGTLRNVTEKRIVFGLKDEVTVRVTYLLPCGVPLANLLICQSLFGMTGLDHVIPRLQNSDPTLEDLDQLQEGLQGARDAQDEGEAFRKLFDELQAGVENPGLQMALFLARGARFHILRREASLPLQGAPICYPTEDRPDCPREED